MGVLDDDRGGGGRGGGVNTAVAVNGAHATRMPSDLLARDNRLAFPATGAEPFDLQWRFRPMTSSIEDVAKLAGVSIATVSRSLRGLPDVATATRDRVFAAAQELDYVASPFAARLASGRTATVGVVVPFVHRWYFAEVLGAVESVLHHAGLDLLLYNLGDEEGRQRFFTRMPVRKRVDAIVIASLVLTDDEAGALCELGVPVGMLGVDQPGLHSTRIDDEQGARDAVGHLVELGHRR